MSKPLPKWMLKVLERPYAVQTPAGDHLYFSRKEEAQAVSRSCRWAYSVFNIQARAWVGIGILD